MATDAPERWTLPGSAGGPLQVARIERDLASMWKSASSRAGGAAVSRACASTLVALDAGAAGGPDDWVGEISRLHPCRVLRVDVVDDGGGAPLTATAGAVCHLRPGGEGQICVEEIRIQVRRRALDRLPSAIRSLAVGGLPLVLFAPTARRGPAFACMTADADLTIVDSRPAGDLLEDDLPVRDLAWSRGSALRRALSLAAGTAAGREVLDSLRQVRVEHGGGATPASALLFAGWLAAALGLSPEGGAGDRALRLSRSAGGAPCELTFQATAAELDDPLAVRLTGDGRATLEVELLPGGVAAGIADRCGRLRAALRRRTRAQRVIDEIHRHRPDPRYLAALERARRMCRALEG